MAHLNDYSYEEEDMNTNEEDMVTNGEDIDKKTKTVNTQAVNPDINRDDVNINVDIIREEANPKPRFVKGPVPLERHYDIFKSVEGKVKELLDGLDHEYYLTGFRVAYDLQDSMNEPGVLPYSVEFGYLGLLDLAVKCSEPEAISDEELKELTKNAPIPIDVLDELYDAADAALQEASAEKIRVGVFIVLNGSREKGYAATCCPNPNSTRRFRGLLNWGLHGARARCSGNCRSH